MTMVGMNGYASRMYTVTGTAVTLSDMGFTEQQIKSADTVHITLENNTDIMRYWYDNTVPTPTEGHPVFATQTLIVRGNYNLSRLRIISTGSTVIAINLGTFDRTPT